MDVKLHLRCSIVLFLVTSCLCEEEPVPEVALSPRNFNPHPYQAGYRATTSKFLPAASAATSGGLLLFPIPTSLPYVLDQRRRYVTGLTGLAGFQKDFRSSVDDHPYHVLAYRRKLEKEGGFLKARDDSSNPQVHKALSKHGAKVLALPSQLLAGTYKRRNYADEKKPYSFSYAVFNQPTGDEFSHHQSQNAAQTKGEYKVKLPDGRLQIVSYTADDNGYKADVKYADQDVIQEEEKPKFVYISGRNKENYPGYRNFDVAENSQPYLQYVADQRYKTFQVAKEKVEHVVHGDLLQSVHPTVASFGVIVPTVYGNIVSTTAVPVYDGFRQKYLSRKPYFR